MSPEIVVGAFVLFASLAATLATLIGVVLRLRAEKSTATTTATQADLAARFDDASELTKYIDTRVEAAVAPIRAELKRVKEESHEIQDAFRTWISGVWLWDQRGRHGDLPMPPVSILARLGLGNFVDEWPTEPPRTIRTQKESP